MTQANRWALVLATGATGTALCLSVLAGWQRGGSLAERLAWVAIGVVLVVSAHMLPALVRDSPCRVRAVAGVLWLACMATACFGHLTFFVLAQRHAGELRATAVPVAEAVSVGRSLTAVMAERAGVTTRLAAANAERCTGNCTTLEARRVTLTTKLDALDAEAGEIRRRQAADDRAMTQREVLVADPVTARLAVLMGTTVTRVDLLSGLAFAAVLEGVACLLWSVTLRSRPPVPAVPATVAGVTVDHLPVTVSHPPESGSHEAAAESHTPVSEPVKPLPASEPPDPAVTQLAQAIAAGRVRPTVADIRRFLGVSQARAAALRRQLSALESTP
ncbi:hypothetical protein [Ralstonia insidiosa]|uniref:hypothetical protein n=1 Tax=Ralstonia insidiosa TaxID=190721 RepID=UPI000CEDC48E|nr:hypothetical protein [Ralstonia insidiosa]